MRKLAAIIMALWLAFVILVLCGSVDPTRTGPVQAINPGSTGPAHATNPISYATPVAAFGSDVTSGDEPLTVHFYDYSTGPPDNYYWTFGDGAHSIARNPTHTYPSLGYGAQYDVTLIVSNVAGADTLTEIGYILSGSVAPTAAFTSNKTSGCPNASVIFTDQSTGTPTEWKWYFGDGDSSVTQNPSHAYTDTSDIYFDVTLIAGNGAGYDTLVSASYFHSLEDAPQITSFSANTTSGPAPLTVTFSYTIDGAVAYSGYTDGVIYPDLPDYGEAVDAANGTAQYVYTEVGTYDVLFNTGSGCGTDYVYEPEMITVYEASSAPAFTASPDYGNVNQGTWSSFTPAVYDSLADLDIAELHIQLFDESDAITDSVRARNSDIVLLDYLQVWGVNRAWQDQPEGSMRRELWDFVDDHEYWVLTADDDTVKYFNPTWNQYLINLVGDGTNADSLASFFARKIRQSDNLQDYTGVLIDYLDYQQFANWQCDIADCRDTVDLDNDGITYYADGDEETKYRQACIDFVTTLRDSVNQENFLIIPNGQGHRYDAFAQHIDGCMVEKTGVDYPSSQAEWDSLFSATRYSMSTDILPQPLIMVDVPGKAEAEPDSVEGALVAIALAANATATISTDAPVTGRRFWNTMYSDVGRVALGAVQEAAVWTTGDTLYRKYAKGFVRITPLDGFPFEYVVVDSVSGAENDTIFISDNWPRSVAPSGGGDLVQGGSYTVVGTGFGSKGDGPNLCAPLKWDDFEDGTPGAKLNPTYQDETEGEWFTNQSITGPPYNYVPVFNDSLSRGAGSISAMQISTAYNQRSAIALVHLSTKKVYVSGWVYNIRLNSEVSHNWKWVACRGGDDITFGGQPELRVDVYPINDPSKGHTYTVDCGELPNVDPGGGETMTYSAFDDESWHRLETWVDLGTPNESDGEFYWKMDGTTIQEASAEPCISGDCDFTKVWITSSLNNAAVPHAAYRIRWDELYIDTTQSRVEIGDASTWSGCTHREIQVPTYWADDGDSVTFTVNRGTFAEDADVWIYVVNSSGTPSTGFSASFGDVVDSTPPDTSGFVSMAFDTTSGYIYPISNHDHAEAIQVDSQWRVSGGTFAPAESWYPDSATDAAIADTNTTSVTIASAAGKTYQARYRYRDASQNTTAWIDTVGMAFTRAEPGGGGGTNMVYVLSADSEAYTVSNDTLYDQDGTAIWVGEIHEIGLSKGRFAEGNLQQAAQTTAMTATYATIRVAPAKNSGMPATEDNDRAALMYFPTDSLLTTDTIVRAELRCKVTSQAWDATDTLSFAGVDQITLDSWWDAQTGAATVYGDASYDYYDTEATSTWTVDPCAGSYATLASVVTDTVPSVTIAINDWFHVDLTGQFESWVEDENTNAGIFIFGNSVTDNTGAYWYSSRYTSDAAKRPFVVIYIER